eukprot:6188236-Pleurochrysis_carterae.AAC.2
MAALPPPLCHAGQRPTPSQPTPVARGSGDGESRPDRGALRPGAPIWAPLPIPHAAHHSTPQ